MSTDPPAGSEHVQNDQFNGGVLTIMRASELSDAGEGQDLRADNQKAPSIRTTFRCRLGVHRFSRWIDGETYTSKRKNSDVGAGIIDGIPYWIEGPNLRVQTRACEDCGLAQARSYDV
jgi:hypothetical protein